MSKVVIIDEGIGWVTPVLDFLLSQLLVWISYCVADGVTLHEVAVP